MAENSKRIQLLKVLLNNSKPFITVQYYIFLYNSGVYVPTSQLYYKAHRSRATAVKISPRERMHGNRGLYQFTGQRKAAADTRT